MNDAEAIAVGAAALGSKVIPAPTVGRTVMFVLDRGPSTGQVRPAVVVRTWGPQSHTVQLAVLTDGQDERSGNDLLPNPYWVSSANHDEPGLRDQADGGSVLPGALVPRTWHWPKR